MAMPALNRRSLIKSLVASVYAPAAKLPISLAETAIVAESAIVAEPIFVDVMELALIEAHSKIDQQIGAEMADALMKHLARGGGYVRRMCGNV